MIFKVAMRLILSAVCLGPALPARAELYSFDKLHTQILFFVNHLGFSNTSGRFLKFDGGFDFEKSDFNRSRVDVSIRTDSIEMDNDRWNTNLRGKDFLNVAKFPKITFRSTKITTTGEKTFDVLGDLTMLDATHPVVLHVTFNKAGAQLATGDYIAGFSATTSLKRSQWGMKYAIPFVGDEVDIRIEVEGSFRR